MNPVPLSVIAGYLGAGKTTLINRLLSEDHGLKLLVMVNDFGAINIDALLLDSANTDTLSLTNGCVCCTIGADLFLALGDALDRTPQPDHIVIEASGIAEPRKIANVALAEPDLLYGGIFTVVDGLNFLSLSADDLIGAQIDTQVAQGDILLISKVSDPSLDLIIRLKTVSDAPVLTLSHTPDVAATLLGRVARQTAPVPKTEHPAYVSWSVACETRIERTSLEAALAQRPAGVFRLKGFVAAPDGTGFEVQIVGRQCSVTPIASRHDTQLVAIGLQAQTSGSEIDAWWRRAIHQ